MLEKSEIEFRKCSSPLSYKKVNRRIVLLAKWRSTQQLLIILYEFFLKLTSFDKNNMLLQS